MTTLIVSISIWVVSVIAYIIFNLYTKNKKLENIVIKQQNHIALTTNLYKEYCSLVDKIDSTMWVQSDPELLSLFENIKQIKTTTEQYLD
jgi:hypothetical protein